MIETKSIDEYSLNEINQIKDSELKLILLKEFYSLLLECKNKNMLTRYAYQKAKYPPNMPLGEFINQINCSISLDYNSDFLFPGNLVMLYPYFDHHVAKKQLKAHLGSDYISPKEEYCRYRPLIVNITNGKRYTLVTSLISEPIYQDLFPTTFRQFENWCYNLEHAYYYNNSEIDFYELSTKLQSDTLQLRELNSDPNHRRLRTMQRREKQLTNRLKLCNPNELDTINKQLNQCKEKTLQLLLDTNNSKMQSRS